MSDSCLGNKRGEYSKDDLNGDKTVVEEVRELCVYSIQGKRGHQVEGLFSVMHLKAASRSLT